MATSKKPAKPSAPPAGNEDELEILPPEEEGEEEEQDDSDAGVPGDETPSADPDQVIEDMKARLADAERLAQEREAENERLRKESGKAAEDKFASQRQLLESKKTEIASIIEAKESKINEVKKARAKALEEADYDKEAELNMELIDLRNELGGAKAFKGRLDVFETEMNEQEKNPQAPAAEQDPDEWVPPPKVQAWIDLNPDFKTDKTGRPLNRFTRIAIAAHEEAIAPVKQGGLGLKAESEAYFTHVDATLIEAGVKDAPEEDEAPPPPPKKRQSFAAPGKGKSAQPAPGKSKGGGKVSLTTEQVRAAKISGMSPEEYYKSLQEIEAETASAND